MMSKIKTFVRLLEEHPTQVMWAFYRMLIKTGFTNVFSDTFHLKICYRLTIGKRLDLKQPRLFNEKLQWLKIHDRNSEYSIFVDKFLVRKYIEEKIGSKYLTKLIGVWNHADEIPFSKLPDKFVLKCTHDSGSTYICTDKKNFDFEKVQKGLEKKLKKNMYWYAREWPYKNVKPRIICEEFLEDGGEEVNDYKFMCFNGNVKCSFVCSERNTDDNLKVTFFDLDWNVMPFERHYPKSAKNIPKPQNYRKMIELSELLAKNIPFVRVDFYEVNGKIYFGELTFFPGAGFEEFTPESYDYILGDWLELPMRNNEG